jgi:hypothetical protein
MTQGSEKPNNHKVNQSRAKLDEARSTLEEHEVEPSSPQEKISNAMTPFSSAAARGIRLYHKLGKIATGFKLAVIKYGQFSGPGFLIAVAYIDP